MKMLYSEMPDFFSPELQQGRAVEISDLKEELRFRKVQGEKDMVIKIGTITVKKFPHEIFFWRTPIMMTG